MNYKTNQNNDLISNSEEDDIQALKNQINRIWEEENLENNSKKPKKQLKSKNILNPAKLNSDIHVELPSHPPVAPKSEKNVYNKNEILDINSSNHPPETSHSNSSGKKTIGNIRFAMMNELKEEFKKRGLQSL